MGDRGVIQVPAGALAYEITSRTPFDAERFETESAALRNELLVQKRDQYRRSLLEHLRDGQQIEINDRLLQRIGG